MDLRGKDHSELGVVAAIHAGIVERGKEDVRQSGPNLQGQLLINKGMYYSGCATAFSWFVAKPAHGDRERCGNEFERCANCG